MPRRELMSWEGSPNFRWVKMHKGVRYRVTCEELQTQRTKEGSIVKANEWWRKKILELEGDQEPDEYTRFFDEIKDGPRSEGQALVDEIAADIVPLSTYKKVVEGVEYAQGRPAQITERSIKECGRSFLIVVRGGLKPRSYEE
ncbi:MAG TPA: hypothetical protein VH682_25850, partial [Gemmataceae bacterium]